MVTMTGFKSFIEEAVRDKKHVDKINGIIEINGLIFFFIKDGEVYGAPEEGRMVFAMMKDPNDDNIGIEDASFAAYSMKQAIAGREIARAFNKKDLKGISVIDQKKAVELLSKK